jgi:hypothetical protein
MRFFEFKQVLSEASILGSNYAPGRPVTVSSGAAGQKLLSKILQVIPDFKPDEVFEKVAAAGPYPAGTSFNVPPNTAVVNTTLPTAKGQIFAGQFKRRSNGQLFTLVGSRDSIEGNLTHYSEYDPAAVATKGKKQKAPFAPRVKGLVAEGLLGVAMYAKLIARGGDLTAKITAQNIWEIVDRVKPVGEDRLVDTVSDINNKVSDTIHLDITLATDVQQVFTNPAFRPIFADTVNSWVKYANSDLAQLYSDTLYKNNRPDNISIILAGKAGEKLDVAINVLDADGRPTRRMEQVKLSVKLSDGLIGQVGRGRTAEEVYHNLQELFDPLGVDLSARKTAIDQAALKGGLETQYLEAMNIGYAEAYSQLRKIADDLKGDVAIAERISKLAAHHATGGDDNIHVIETAMGGDYRLLNYKGLKQVFKQNNINIDLKFYTGNTSKVGGGLKTPGILFFDVNDPGPSGRLVDVRVRARGGEGKAYVNHIIEPLPLMKELAAFRRFRKKP